MTIDGPFREERAVSVCRRTPQIFNYEINVNCIDILES